MRRNFSFESNSGMRSKKRPQKDTDKQTRAEMEKELIVENTDKEELVEELVEDLDEKELIQADKDNEEQVIIEDDIAELEPWENEEQAVLPAKLPGPLGFIDEDMLILIVIFIMLKGPRKDFSLIFILFWLFMSK